MNERIKQIAVQAANRHGHTIKFSPEITEVLDTFAELIIQQCCDIVHDKTDDSIRVVHAIEVTFGLD